MLIGGTYLHLLHLRSPRTAVNVCKPGFGCKCVHSVSTISFHLCFHHLENGHIWKKMLKSAWTSSNIFLKYTQKKFNRTSSSGSFEMTKLDLIFRNSGVETDQTNYQELFYFSKYDPGKTSS